MWGVNWPNQVNLSVGGLLWTHPLSCHCDRHPLSCLCCSCGLQWTCNRYRKPQLNYWWTGSNCYLYYCQYTRTTRFSVVAIVLLQVHCNPQYCALVYVVRRTEGKLFMCAWMDTVRGQWYPHLSHGLLAWWVWWRICKCCYSDANFVWQFW